MQFRAEPNVMAQSRPGLLDVLVSGLTLVSLQVMNVHSSRTLDVQFLDTGTVTSVKISELREIPSRFLQEVIAIPSQVPCAGSPGDRLREV